MAGISGPGAPTLLVDGTGTPLGTAGNPLNTSGGGGGGGAVTVADGADVTQGAKADAAYAGSGSSSVVAALKGVYAAIVAALPAGTNLIGNVGVAQASTTSGQSGPLVQGAVTTVGPTYVTTQTSPLSLTIGGGLRITPCNVSGVTALLNFTSAAAPPANVGYGIQGLYNSTPLVLTTGQSAGAAANTAGMLQVDTENLKASFMVSGTFTPAATPSDIVTLSWVSKTVRIRRVVLYGYSTTAGQMTASIFKRSTANSGGTSTAPTPTLMDSLLTAATATVAQYSANPTPGSNVGSGLSRYLNFGLAGASNMPEVFDFGAMLGGGALVLRAASQVMAISLNSGSVPAGGVVSYEIYYTEE